MSAKKYSVVVLGAGKRGKLHAELFHQNDRFDLVGICDIDNERLQALAALTGNPPMYNDAEKMLKETKPDIFCFCTPPALRLNLFKLGADHNVKLIAYEKPMAMSIAEAQEIMKIAKEKGIKTTVSHQHKYGDHYASVKEIIDSGKLGRIHTVYGHCWGWYLHMATHIMDYIRFMNNNAEAEWIIGQVHGREKLTDNHPSPDWAGGFIQFANGVRGIVEIGALSPDVPEVEYQWHKGRVGVQGTEGFAEILIGGNWRAVTPDGVLSGPGKFDYMHDQGGYIQDIALWLDGVKEHPCSGESTYKGFELAMGLLRSATERKLLKFPLSPGEPEIAALNKIIPE